MRTMIMTTTTTTKTTVTYSQTPNNTHDNIFIQSGLQFMIYLNVSTRHEATELNSEFVLPKFQGLNDWGNVPG